MGNDGTLKQIIVDLDGLPALFPTHKHSPEFWEYLGRTIATFGYLEEVLGKAIFAFTATRRYAADEIDAAFQTWLPQLERALTDPLSNLAESYEKSVRENPASIIENVSELVHMIKETGKIRNVLCHASWRAPDTDGKSFPLFVAQKSKEVFETKIDIAFLRQVQCHVVELICAVINSVTQMGWQFPGSTGPGKPILPRA